MVTSRGLVAGSKHSAREAAIISHLFCYLQQLILLNVLIMNKSRFKQLTEIFGEIITNIKNFERKISNMPRKSAI